MLDYKENYDILYIDGRWRIYGKDIKLLIPNISYGSKVEAELGLEDELEYWNLRNKDNVT